MEAHYQWLQTDPDYIERKKELDQFWEDLETKAV